jgi:hypothetical protein
MKGMAHDRSRRRTRHAGRRIDGARAEDHHYPRAQQSISNCQMRCDSARCASSPSTSPPLRLPVGTQGLSGASSRTANHRSEIGSYHLPIRIRSYQTAGVIRLAKAGCATRPRRRGLDPSFRFEAFGSATARCRERSCRIGTTETFRPIDAAKVRSAASRG